jgi:hypothetical protein
MEENVDIANPMYLGGTDGDDEAENLDRDFSIESDRVSHHQKYHHRWKTRPQELSEEP